MKRKEKQRKKKENDYDSKTQDEFFCVCFFLFHFIESRYTYRMREKYFPDDVVSSSRKFDLVFLILTVGLASIPQIRPPETLLRKSPKDLETRLIYYTTVLPTCSYRTVRMYYKYIHVHSLRMIPSTVKSHYRNRPQSALNPS